MAMVEVKRDFKVLGEVISPENVQVMAELITIKQTKCLIGYIGENAIKAHDKVYYDVVRKDELGYVLSDYYDLVQDVAVFLCEHFGKYLDDYLYTSKKGKAVTVKTECYYIIKRELYKRYSVGVKKFSLEMFKCLKDKRDFMETSDEEIEESYNRAENIISLMNLGEKHFIVLNARLQGISYIVGDYNLLDENTEPCIREAIIDNYHLRTYDKTNFIYYTFNSRWTKISFDLKMLRTELIKLRALIADNPITNSGWRN